MKKITDFIVEKKYFIITIFLIFTIISTILSNQVQINNDMTKYMPKNSETSQGLAIMESEFIEEDTSYFNIMFKNLSPEEKDEIYKQLTSIEGIASITYDNSSNYNIDENTLYVINVDDATDSQTATSVYETVTKNYEDYEFYTNGPIASHNITVLPKWIMVLAVSICLVILLIMCESYIEPFLFLTCIGIAVLLNKGTNIIFPSVSNITNSISAILQLALSMDYSIMLINRYKQEKEENQDNITAMKEALYKSFSSISSSSITTIVSLVTLIFMSFTIGRDLGLVLAKGVLFSLLTIFTCLPALIVIFDKLITKTTKKAPNINLNHFGSFIYKIRYIGLILLVIFFVISYILKGNLSILYTISEDDVVAEVFPNNNQMAIIYEQKDEDKISSYISTLEQDNSINEVLAYGNTIGEPLKYNEFNKKLTDLKVDTTLDEYLFKILYYKYYNDNVMNTMTFPEFVSFTKESVLSNTNFSSKFDSTISEYINRLQNFTSSLAMNKKRTYQEIANLLEIDEQDCYNLFVYYYSTSINNTMTIQEFINFMDKEIIGSSQTIPQTTKDNLKTISKFLDKETLNKEMTSQEMANLFGIDYQQVQNLYLYYYSLQGTTNQMTLYEFSSFVLNNVITDPTYSKSITTDTITQLKMLNTMSNKNIINKNMNINELSSLFNIDEETIASVILLKNSMTETDTSILLSDLVNFFVFYLENGENDFEINTELINTLVSLVNNIDNINNTKMNREELTTIFSPIFENLVDIVYTNAHLPNTYQMTPREFLEMTITNFSSDIESEDLEKIKLFKFLIDDSLNPQKYTATALTRITAADPSVLYSIYAIYIYNNHLETPISPFEFISFIIQNSETEKLKSEIDQPTLTKIQTAYAIMNSANQNTNYTYEELASFTNMDTTLTKQLYALQASSKDSLTLNSVTFTEFLLSHQNDTILKQNLDHNTIKTLELLFKIIKSVLDNQKYTPPELAELLNLSEEDTRLIYSLYSFKNTKDNHNISLKEFITFTINNVLQNPKYSSSFNEEKITKLNTINGIMKASLNQTKYNPEEIFAILSNLSNDIEESTIELLYIYYGSEKHYNETWAITIEQFINYVNDNIINDPRFNDFIDKDMKNQITSAKTTIADNKKLLIGNKYSRIVLNTHYALEGEETFSFINQLHTALEDIEIYAIGDSPMAYEMSKTFSNEFDKISIISMIAIFIVVAITFKSIGIPLVLVLLIQCAVYMTMGILSLLGGNIYFIAILIVQSILMGATIDYAILYTSYYEESRLTMNIKDSIINSYNKSIHTILTSSSILILATLVVGKFASAIVAKICAAISKGVTCSTILILLILPAVLATLDRLVIRKRYQK